MAIDVPCWGFGEYYPRVFSIITGSNRGKRERIAALVRQIPERSSLSLLDVGSGGSDLSHSLPASHQTIAVTSLDINLGACNYSRDSYPGLTVVNGSVLNMPFKERSFDIVHASLFLHHFTETELNAIIISLFRVSRYGVVINDLRRSLFAYIGIVALTQLFSRSDMIRNDAPISVRRGFAYKELKQLFSQLPSGSCSIWRMWAFRWCVTICKDHAAE